MSVFTAVSEPELRTFLENYELGELVEYRGITAGIENSNFFVSTDQGRFVLTLFEKHTAEEMPYYLNLMAHLAERDIPCPHPLPDTSGAYLRTLNGKPAALVQRLEGANPDTPTTAQCRAVGAVLGRLHLAATDYGARRNNDRGPQWWREASRTVMPKLSEEDAALLAEEVRFQGLYRFEDLPRGVIHADLFRDNAMFIDERLTGIIDFYYACDDVLLYDLAICANDWCSRTDGGLDWGRLEALLRAYHEQRPMQALERGAWPVMLRAAALRFWLSRLWDLHFPREGEITHTHDPDVFKHVLRRRIADETELQMHWV